MVICQIQIHVIMNPNKESFQTIIETLSNEDDFKIVERFNANVRNKHFNTFLSVYLSAIHSEFEKRNIDYHKIGNSRSLSFKSKVVLISKTLIPINENMNIRNSASSRIIY